MISQQKIGKRHVTCQGKDIRQSALQFTNRLYGYNSKLLTTFNIPNSDINVSATVELKLNNNPAYETQTPLQKNLAYEDTTLAIKESQAMTTPAEPAYEIISLIPIQAASATTQMPSSGGEDGYNKLNRDIVKRK